MLPKQRSILHVCAIKYSIVCEMQRCLVLAFADKAESCKH